MQTLAKHLSGKPIVFVHLCKTSALTEQEIMNFLVFLFGEITWFLSHKNSRDINDNELSSMHITFLSACSQFCVVMQRKVFDIMQDFIFQFAIKYLINL